MIRSPIRSRLPATALLLLLPTPASLPLIDETFRVRASGWRAVPVILRQRPADLVCSFSVVSGGSGVRMSLARILRSRSGSLTTHRLAATPYARSDGFRYGVREPGEYAILLDNRLEGRGPAEVHLKVSVVFIDASAPVVRVLPPKRRLLIVVLSLLGFAAIVFWSGRRLLSAIQRQRNRGQPAPFS